MMPHRPVNDRDSSSASVSDTASTRPATSVMSSRSATARCDPLGLDIRRSGGNHDLHWRHRRAPVLLATAGLSQVSDALEILLSGSMRTQIIGATRSF